MFPFVGAGYARYGLSLFDDNAQGPLEFNLISPIVYNVFILSLSKIQIVSSKQTTIL
jgi:hypothetical protein